MSYFFRQNKGWVQYFYRLAIMAAIFLFGKFLAFAHEGELDEAATESTPNLEAVIKANSLWVVSVASVIIIIALLIVVFFKNFSERAKPILFWSIIAPTIIATFYLVGSTIYLNQVSQSKGPVHWHADYQIWNCGQQIELTNPVGFSNKVGSSTFHEHNDNRIHVEGVVINHEDVMLGEFFETVGGHMDDGALTVPTTGGMVTMADGQPCADGKPGRLQVFVYKTDENTKQFTQSNVANPKHYVLSPYGNVPPGDCIIIEFSPEKLVKTQQLCDTYRLQLAKGTIHGDVPDEMDEHQDNHEIDITPTPLSTENSAILNEPI